MSDPFPPSPRYPPAPPGASTAPPPFGGEAPAEPPRHSSGRVFAIVGAVAIFVAGVGLVLWVTFGRADGPSHPDDWDPRVADIAEFVQTERGVLFDHPVHVDFLSDEEFTADVTASEDDLTDEDRESIEQAESMLRALGLAPGDVDLFDNQNQLMGEGVLAYYDPEEERIRVRGVELTPDVEVTLAHELTHALQDQFVDLDEVRDGLDDDAQGRYRAVVEGDASNVENAYIEEELTEAERGEYQRVSAAEADEIDLEGIPPALVAYFQAPYAFGPYFDQIVERQEGVAGLNNLLREPPESDRQLFDPRVYFDGDGPEPVDIPPIPDGAEPIDDGEFGALTWYVMLASRIPPIPALDVIDNWAGDSFVSYDDDGEVCVKARYRAPDPAAAQIVQNRLESWIDASRSEDTSLSKLDDRTLELLACDPGLDAAAGTEVDPSELLTTPATRLALVADALGSLAGDLDGAWCAADGVVRSVSPEDLASGELSASERQAIDEVMQNCGLQPA